MGVTSSCFFFPSTQLCCMFWIHWSLLMFVSGRPYNSAFRLLRLEVTKASTRENEASSVKYQYICDKLWKCKYAALQTDFTCEYLCYHHFICMIHLGFFFYSIIYLSDCIICRTTNNDLNIVFIFLVPTDCPWIIQDKWYWVQSHYPVSTVTH